MLEKYFDCTEIVGFQYRLTFLKRIFKKSYEIAQLFFMVLVFIPYSFSDLFPAPFGWERIPCIKSHNLGAKFVPRGTITVHV